MIYFWLIFAAYYVVGIAVFVRDLKETSDDVMLMRQFNEELNHMTNLELVWDAIKLLLFVVFIHIPCWILRV
ncbi:hypothetical protein MPK64_gp305 [Erwinia phage pEa_SNUABM_16]|uniref:Uncharacterized protein n=1 Tax=Erwinia phage pEa_SNUABM_16 TaxID=2869544 RepID=A0AAE8XR41_9CAUD|nr:hypothetical protein MPK64_gp305 [Erwinia phage pEa_SNUABM_16]QZE59207.1 hypothetical protein pEaSNUABM18_00304 [Erwinia phage pEa_SNUABM_18]UAW96449.1 hypothetical protein pEaSNUABM16_00305 [Erwinia phage pEa_SNUABM_16]